jgi:hypothetical protein
MQPQLRALVERIRPAEIRDIVEGVFSDLNRLLGYLDSVKTNVRVGGPVAGAHFIFEAVRGEALVAACGLDSVCVAPHLSVELAEELERTSFAVRHELRTVFERILPGSRESEDEAEARLCLADAHDLLRNCFEQSTVSLARVFRPEVDAADIFDEVRVRRENSLRLYEDLNALLRSARYAERQGGEAAFSLFAERLEHFRRETVEYLMQKDADTCRKFADDYEAIKGKAVARFFLHRFSCYLEILLKHVGMRSVLAEVPLSMAA